MSLKSLHRVLFGILFALSSPFAGQAASAASDIPAWLQAHVGTGEGKIAPVVLERARALYVKNRQSGKVSNPCYLAMDATRPSTAPNGAPGARFYVICEADRSFRAVSSGYGNGRKLQRADFSNGRQCAKNFSNAEGSKLTMGGAYTTAETRTSFKGYYSQSGQRKPFYRTFLLFDGEGDTENARERAIGGHPAVFLKWQCRFKNPSSPNADKEGYVPYGNLVNYTGGRSNGCTTWSPAVSDDIIELVDGNPTSLYIYPEGSDIDAVANAVRTGSSLSRAGLYWNAACLSAIGAPKFWPKRTLQPVINNWRQSLPNHPPRDLPICK
ncbi:murein L,D-transpeptidase catalytic domain family protein [Alloyangia pacifica]|uniref:murein L,D-transpeptidase catalytic domain family protein n=1 Tax=Alloyangia pacifica TaxID=311180 RepID=UPI001CD284C3|nr:murein L,D-transpeptidase catalytic domain family protein [Alloyangia pacifica]MCA0997349.1 murein L,D-transpeptidase catalytic domain family protein [Alloyangia pacifica]